jgi:hypothetical protein
MREALHANLLRARRDGDLRGLSLLPLACLLAFVKLASSAFKAIFREVSDR